MTSALLLAGSLLLSQDGSGISQWTFRDQAKTFDRFKIQIRQGELVPPKKAPRKDWEYRFLSAGYAQLEPEVEQHELRFRIYGQVRENPDLGPLVGRHLLKLWEINFDELRIDHADAYGRVVDVYLSNEGKAGGEQMFAVDHPLPDGRRPKVNAIFIYQLETFTNFVEMARELSHEYGHATLPAVGGFKQPENWANGELGERLYLRRLRKGAEAQRYEQVDMMGATVPDLKKYEQTKIDPLIDRVALGGPEATPFQAMNQQSMEYYLAMTLWAEDLFPDATFRRMILLGGATPKEAAVTLVDEAQQYEGPLEVPERFKGRSIWIPVGNASLSGAKPLATRQGWVRVAYTGQKLAVKPRQK